MTVIAVMLCLLATKVTSSVRLIRASPKMLFALVPFDDERNSVVLLLLEKVDVARAPCTFFAAKGRLELRCQVERECLVLCAAWSIQC